MSINKVNKEINQLIFNNKNLDYLKKDFKDFSYLKTYTIDNCDTIEIDDAISLERISNNYKIWIHIASPAAHIEYESEIDKKAREVTSTLYLASKNIYMLPEILIKNIFSLRNREKRASLSLGVILNNDGSVKSSEIVRSLVEPNFNLSYEEADELIDYAPIEEEDLSIIYRILEKRRLWRKEQGAREIIESCGKFIVKDNKPYLKLIHPSLSRLLISEAMILYGNLLSIYTQENKIPVPYRVQEGNDYLYDQIKTKSENEILYNYLLKKSMGKTHYSIKPLKHFSLGLGSYLQASSPIRRYSDLLVHYQITRFLNNKDLISKNKIDKNILEINKLTRQNINRFREDQKLWINKWFENNKSCDYNAIFLNWINKYKNICLIYFLEFNFSTISFLKTKKEIEPGDNILIRNETNDYNDILYFKFIP